MVVMRPEPWDRNAAGKSPAKLRSVMVALRVNSAAGSIASPPPVDEKNTARLPTGGYEVAGEFSSAMNVQCALSESAGVATGAAVTIGPDNGVPKK